MREAQGVASRLWLPEVELSRRNYGPPLFESGDVSSSRRQRWRGSTFGVLQLLRMRLFEKQVLNAGLIHPSAGCCWAKCRFYWNCARSAPSPCWRLPSIRQSSSGPTWPWGKRRNCRPSRSSWFCWPTHPPVAADCWARCQEKTAARSWPTFRAPSPEGRTSRNRRPWSPTCILILVSDDEAARGPSFVDWDWRRRQKQIFFFFLASSGSGALEEAKTRWRWNQFLSSWPRKILARNLFLRFRQFRGWLASGGGGGLNRASGRGNRRMLVHVVQIASDDV